MPEAINNPSPRSGGCQCGAIRYKVAGALGRATICHCRMCQKATGGFFGALVSVRQDELTWTRGQPKRFESSNLSQRGFCPDCGTPLTFEWSGKWIDLYITTFDEPGGIVPVMQLAHEFRLPYADATAGLPVPEGKEASGMAERYGQVISHQHPDHDTEIWPKR